MGEMIVGLIDYNKAGQERWDLAEKLLYCQLTLARAGFSTGGRAPYGFCRWQVKEDGTKVRRLEGGDWSRRAGHHVVWLPAEDERVWAIIGRILDLLVTTPASQVAALLTAEGVPPPDAGRERTDNGVRHKTSGVWYQVTVVGITRNPLLRAVVDGRRAEREPGVRRGGNVRGGPPPVELYEGPTGWRALSARPENSPVGGESGGGEPQEPPSSRSGG